MREIKEIIIHCSATREGHDITASIIDDWHKNKGWKGIGYHYFIRLDGTIEYGRMVNRIGAHTKGKNKTSIGVCYAGGCDRDLNPKDTRTLEQKESLLLLLTTLKKSFPNAVIHSHNDFSNKACPSFNATKEYTDLSEIFTILCSCKKKV